MAQRNNVVVATGAKWNPCGHAILNAGGNGGHYFHIAGDGYVRPYYMTQNGYERYLSENKKREVRRRHVPLRRPDRAQTRLDLITNEPQPALQIGTA